VLLKTFKTKGLPLSVTLVEDLTRFGTNSIPAFEMRKAWDTLGASMSSTTHRVDAYRWTGWHTSKNAYLPKMYSIYYKCSSIYATVAF
jgi:hypothetical protein